METKKSDIIPGELEQSRYANYVSELKLLDPSDPELTQKVNRIGERYGLITGDRNHDFTHSNIMKHPFEYSLRPFFNSKYDPFRSFSRNIDNIFNSFSDHFNSMDANEWKNLEDEIPQTETENKDKPRAYCKYTSSFTSYDENGKKKSVTVSGIEKKVGKQRYSSKKKTTIDGDNIIEEHYRPDGSVKTTTQKMKTLDRK